MSAAALRLGWLATALGLAIGLGAAGCTTDAFCFAECNEGATSSSSSGTGGSGGDGGCLLDCTTTGTGAGGAGGGMACVPTNGGIEICDGLDNDCNGAVDDLPDLDPTSILTCGTCDNNCLAILTNNDPATIECNAGVCTGDCAPDYYDVDGNGSCEYYCLGGSDPESICNNIDDDCDGQKDEDVDLCTSLDDCGQCGHHCVALHGTAACVNNGQMPCSMANTQCQIANCECPDAQGICWNDLDGLYATGCEYACQITNGGVEICDGLDNDCDGLIDAADDLSGDPGVGVACYGDPDGECATPAHQGMTMCQGGQITCGGPNVLVQNQQPELCNNLDDNCDGIVDNNPTDAGASCGVSNIFPCSFGTTQCQGGALVCLGAVNPQTETCNGVDDDCDGNIDLTGNMPPADSVGMCNVPPPPPAGVPQPCQAGNKACVGGAIVCQGSILPQSQTDACGIDSNCDGALSNQPDLMTDVAHCGSCANNCYTGAVHSTWSCQSGMCQFQGCAPGYYDLDGDQQCEYACVYVQPNETCNGVDDNCNGQVDEGLVAPSPVQVCGVSPSALSPECTTQVTVSCVTNMQGTTWQCSFPNGVCNNPGGCSATPEICDTLDNNCNGLVNENTPNYNMPCASDEGLPPPGHGACRTTGTFVCNGPNAVMCNAMPASCASLPGGCTEYCDGIDNDCDGVADEPASAPGANATYFVRPVVTRVAASLWMYSYEASRPNATATNPGSGNGYHTSAPPGETLDHTNSCSEPGKVPWFNVTPREVEQTCIARGGTICNTADWTPACQATASCNWGFNPRGSACTSAATAAKYCNLGPTYDFNSGAMGDQDGLLPTASSLLGSCWADWSNLQGNTAATNRIYDITGNLREITKKPGANQYALMGGAFDTADEGGATCSFSFYTVNQTFKYYDTGFRCCFTSNPSP